jgi:AcrR family transcriptional regulator
VSRQAAAAPQLEALAAGAVDPRQRLVAGLAQAIRDTGYRETTVADIVRHAHTSRRTFYEHFASRQDCLVALLVQVNELLVRHIDASVDRSGPWRDQVRQAITAWLEGAQAEPALTLAWVRDAPGLGEVAGDLHQLAQQAFVDLARDLAANPALAREGLRPLSPEMAVILVGGLGELIATQVERGGDVAEIQDTAVAAATALLQAG